MSVKSLIFGVACFALPYSLSWSAPMNGFRSGMNDDSNPLVKQMRIIVADLKHEIGNYDVELRTLQEKAQNQELLIDQLRQQLTDDFVTQKETTQLHFVTVEGKLETLDTFAKGLTADIRQLKTQANESVTILSQYKQKLLELEKLIDAQNQHMQNLETAMRSIIELVQAKEGPGKTIASKSPSSGKTYKVQTGDTLGQIARDHGISLQALKEANGLLLQDRIRVEQVLKIP